MAEDPSKNRLVEALDLFEQIVNSHHFEDTNIILFLNKQGSRDGDLGTRSNNWR